MNNLTGKKIILGSKSPRRRQLLSEAGISFEIRIQDIEENFNPDMPVLEVAEDLAKRKADALVQTLSAEEILITADSVVILDGVIFNKPENYQEGIKMLSVLSNRTHKVATGVCIRTLTSENAFTVITLVTFGVLSDEEIDYYLLHHKPYDKAGAYGIQDWIGLTKVTKIEGSYSNVMGLPVSELYEALKKIN